MEHVAPIINTGRAPNPVLVRPNNMSFSKMKIFIPVIIVLSTVSAMSMTVHALRDEASYPYTVNCGNPRTGMHQAMTHRILWITSISYTHFKTNGGVTQSVTPPWYRTSFTPPGRCPYELRLPLSPCWDFVTELNKQYLTFSGELYTLEDYRGLPDGLLKVNRFRDVWLVLSCFPATKFPKEMFS